MDSNVVWGLTYAREIILLLGAIGNILTFVVYSRKKFAKNSISVYCRALAIADFLRTIQLVYDVITNQLAYDLIDSSDAACKIYYFVIMCIAPVSDWLLVTFSFDNMVRVWHTLHFNFIFQRRYQIMIVAGLVLFNFGLFGAVPLSLSLKNVTNASDASPVCADLTSLSVTRTFLHIYVVESIFLPFVLMLVSSVVIVRCLQQSRMRIVQIKSERGSKRKTREFKFAASAVLFNIIFGLLKFPVSLYYYIILSDSQASLMFFLASQVIITFYHSSRFLVHLAGNVIFRREFMALIKSGTKNVRNYANFNSKRTIKTQTSSNSPLY